MFETLIMEKNKKQKTEHWFPGKAPHWDNRSHLILFKSAVFYFKIVAAPVWAFVHNSNSYLTVLASDTVKKTEALSEVLKIPGSLKCPKVGGGDGERSYYPWLVSPVNKVSRFCIRSTVGDRVGEWMDE